MKPPHFSIKELKQSENYISAAFRRARTACLSNVIKINYVHVVRESLEAANARKRKGKRGRQRETREKFRGIREILRDRRSAVRFCSLQLLTCQSAPKHRRPPFASYNTPHCFHPISSSFAQCSASALSFVVFQLCKIYG